MDIPTSVTCVKLNDFVHESLQGMVVVTGFPRGGTTIVGKIVGTFQSVEYAYEPELVAYMDARWKFKTIRADEIVEWLGVYLYYVYFLNYIHGRHYNFRPSDDSCIFKMKPYDEIVRRWFAVKDTQQALSAYAAAPSRFAFKTPNLHNLLPVILQGFANVKIVDVRRELGRVLASMIAKGWFSDENVGENATGVWPFHDCESQVMVPYLVDEADIDFWSRANAVSRSAYICNQLAASRLSFQEYLQTRADYQARYFDLSYEALTSNSDREVSSLAAFLEVEEGPLTRAVIREIRRTPSAYDVPALLQACDPQVRTRFLDLAAAVGR